MRVVLDRRKRGGRVAGMVCVTNKGHKFCESYELAFSNDIPKEERDLQELIMVGRVLGILSNSIKETTK